VSLDAGLPLKELSVPTHEVETSREGLSRASVRIKPSDSIPNKDFVLRYRLTAEQPQAAVLSQPASGGGGTFLVLLQPGLERELGEAPPRDLCFLVDVSGSMQGAPIAKSKEVMKGLLQKMRPQDRMQLILFASQSRKIFESYLPASPENLEAAMKAVDQQQGGGGTEMLAGVRMALADPDPSRMRIVLMLTDGFVGNEAGIIAEAGNRCGDTVRFWVVGIGNSVNQFLVDGVAGVAGGMGELQSLREDAAPLVEKVLSRLHRAQLAGVTLDWGGLAVREVVPQRIPDLWAGAPVLLLGRYEKAGVGSLTLKGSAEGKPVFVQAQVCFSDADQGNEALANVWARRKIEALGRELAKANGSEKAVEELKAEITRLGLEFKLVTEYTSFVAVEETVAPGADGKPEKKVVPVPLPEGTTFEGKYWNSAIGIGGGAGGTLGGRFGGKRTLRAYGGGRHTESAVMMGLVWLKNHQSPDGSWSSASFPSNCKKGTCDGAGTGSDWETTGVSLLAFLGAGHTHKHGKFKNTVKDALKFLQEKQNADGSFGGEGGTAQDLRAHAVCAFALAEVYGLSGKSGLLVGMAQKAVDYLVSTQLPGSGWAAKKGAAADTVTTGWAVLALKAAQLSGLNVPKGSLDAALKWFDAMADAATYGTAFASAGDKGADPGLPGADPLTATAAATIGRIFIGGNATANAPEVLGGGNLLKLSPPKWDVQAGTVDVEYWYFGTLAMFQLGREYWKSWNEPMKNAVVPTQKRENCENGSWDPIGACAARMGRVWTTAMNTLTLEIYYRYGRVLNARAEVPAAEAETPAEKKAEAPAEKKAESPEGKKEEGK
jgi:hypothetical protein